MQTQEADGWSLTMFINPKRSRQENGLVQPKGLNLFRDQYVWKGRQIQGQGRQHDQAGGKVVQSQAVVKTWKTSKSE